MTTRAEVNDLLDRVQLVLNLPEGERHAKAEKLLGALPPIVRASIWKLAGALAFGATGALAESPVTQAAVSGLSDEQGKAHVQLITDVMALVVLTCTHGVALEVEERDITQGLADGTISPDQVRSDTDPRRDKFKVRGGGDEHGVPYGTKWDGGPDGKGH